MKRNKKPTTEATPTRTQSAWEKDVIRLGAECREAKEIWQSAKEDASEKKKAYDALVDSLIEATRDQPMPLFGENKNGVHPSVNGDGDESWREVSIATLGLPAGLVAKLKDANIEILGQLANFTSEGNILEQIAGVGQAAARKIEKAVERYWETQKKAAAEVVKEVATATKA